MSSNYSETLKLLVEFSQRQLPELKSASFDLYVSPEDFEKLKADNPTDFLPLTGMIEYRRGEFLLCIGPWVIDDEEEEIDVEDEDV